MNKRIVFTGGHHNSALAVALDIKKDGYEVHWLGHKYSMWGDKSPSGEYRDVTSSGIPFYELKAGKFYKTYNPLKLVRIPRGFIEAFSYLRQIRPDLIVSFGGYLAVPVAITGWLMGVPVITHEQTSVTGLSNSIIGRIAKRVFLTFTSSKRYFPPEKTTVLGLPLADISQYRRRLAKQNKPQIFVTGGKQESHVINTALFPIVKNLCQKFTLVHQTGTSTVFSDFAKAREIVLPNYRPVDYLSQNDMYRTMSKSSLIIGRSGAHTVYEAGLMGIPALFIPIPWVVNNEQYKNAQILKEAGSAEILPEKDLHPETLLKMIELMLGRIDIYERNAQKAKTLFPLDAREKLVGEIKAILR